MSHSPCLCVFRCSMLGHGQSNELRFWKNWAGNCAACGQLRSNGAGIFCANFSSARGPFPPCRKVWCGRCYSVPAGNPYPIRRAEDEDGFVCLTEGDQDRFKFGRDGDFLMTPFQCDICHFRNIQGRNPSESSVFDIRLLKDIRQANIDALWSREPSTVSGNLSQARRMERIGAYYGFESVSPALGPFPLSDTFGMKAAVCMLRRSLDKGRTEEHVQFRTARKLRSAFSNAYHASCELSNVAAMAFESTKTYSTTCPTYGYWFERFILGCHKRMGDVVVSDFALSLPIFRELLAHRQKRTA